MIVDFHTHIFPAFIRNSRENFFTSEPEFKLLYQSPRSRLSGAQALIGAMDTHGVDRSVVFGFPWRDPETARRHNDYILQSVQRHPTRLIGFCCLDPTQKGAPEEAKRCITAGLAGVGELACYGPGTEGKFFDALDPIMALCRERDLPVLIHANEPVGHCYPGKTQMTLRQIYELIKRYTRNKIVLAHWGGGIFFFHLLKKEVKTYFKNIFFDTAASPFLYDISVYPIAVRILGAEKILFGSDYPLLTPDRYVSDMNASGASQADIRAICGLNAAHLLNL